MIDALKFRELVEDYDQTYPANTSHLWRWLLDNRHALLALVEDGWQPIETAPRDGTRVLISFWLHNKPDGERVSIVAYWVEGEGWMIDQEMQWYPYAPTHWRPLPPPPETKP